MSKKTLNPDLFRPVVDQPPASKPAASSLPKTHYFQPYNFQEDFLPPGARGQLADLLKSSGQEKIADRYRDCRRKILKLECAERLSDRCRTRPGRPDPGAFIAIETCKARFCEPCARSFGFAWRRKVRPFILSLAGKSRLRRLKHITIGWKRPPDEYIDSAWVKARFKEVGQFVRRFYHDKSKSGQYLAGAIAVMEMSGTGYFHVHLLAYGYYQHKETLSDAWKEITGDSYRVGISDAEKGPQDVLNELTKYIVKPVRSILVDQVFHYAGAIKGRRRIHTWGIFYNCDQVKPPSMKGHCPFCGSALRFVGSGTVEDCLANDGSTWPAWTIAAAIRRNGFKDLPDRYG